MVSLRSIQAAKVVEKSIEVGTSSSRATLYGLHGPLLRTFPATVVLRSTVALIWPILAVIIIIGHLAGNPYLRVLRMTSLR